MSDLNERSVDVPTPSTPEESPAGGDGGPPLLEVRNLCKYYGNVIALQGITTTVRAGQVTCVLGDNGAGKSSFIKILSGVHGPSDGNVLLDGELVTFASPREALDRGIATVYQDLAVVPLMSVWRNFWLGDEPRRGFGPFQSIDIPKAKRIAKEELLKMGIDIRDTEQAVGTLSGGERQSVAIARAAYRGARVLILDEPTSALGVKQSGVVLRYIVEAARRNLGVIFITHNPHHAWPVGDRFLILNRGQSLGNFAKEEIDQDALTGLDGRRCRAARAATRAGHCEVMDLELLTIGRVSVDLYAEQLGVPIRQVTTFRKSIGGTATNVAVAAARLGHRAAVLTKVGDDPFGDYVRWALADTFGVDTRFVGTDPSLRTPLAFAELDPPDDPRIIFYREPKAPDLNLAPEDVDAETVRAVPVLWVSLGALSAEPSRSTVHQLLAARAGRAETVVDLDWRPQMWDAASSATREVGAALDRATIAIGNRAECEVAVGTTDPDEAADATARPRPAGGDRQARRRRRARRHRRRWP